MTDPRYLILFIPVILWALSFHEVSHAWVALRFGDPTARDQGRISLNPLRHLDPLGTLMMFVAGFGWAKPVPVDYRNLREPLRNGLWIAAAGPTANFLTALACGLLVQGIFRGAGGRAALDGIGGPILQLLVLSVQVNLALCVFNLIPIHPLDGSQVLKGLVSPRTAESLARLDPMGPILLIALIVGGRAIGVDPLGFLLGPVVGKLRALVTGGLL
jgi:Zn-dependent protease